MAEPRELLLRTRDLLEHGLTREAIRRAVRSTDLVRVRRGAYCAGRVWEQLDDRQRHLVRAAAVVADVDAPLLTGLSAAAIWGIPTIDDLPAEVHLLAPYGGGGKSEPGVRRTSIGARGAPREVVDGLPVTSLAWTVVDLASRLGFVQGVMAADFALRAGVTREQLLAALESRSSRYGRSAAHSAIEFADARAENGGESILGFTVPDLQVVVVDRQGEMRVDFRWRRVDGSWVYGEFDGKQKYTRAEFSKGDPAEMLWREKKREDRLRVGSHGVVRILWSHVFDHRELTLLLSEARVPRRGSARVDPVLGGFERAVIQPSATSSPG
jgi:hypothetical protein